MSALSPQICQFFRGRLAPNPRVYMATFFYPLKCISVRVVLSIPRALASIVHRPSLGCRLHNVYWLPSVSLRILLWSHSLTLRPWKWSWKVIHVTRVRCDMTERGRWPLQWRVCVDQLQCKYIPLFHSPETSPPQELTGSGTITKSALQLHFVLLFVSIRSLKTLCSSIRYIV